MEKYITQNGIKYELRREQYYPMLEIAEQKEHKIGKYGLLHRDYIRQHKRGSYTTLLTDGRLNSYLHEIDVAAFSFCLRAVNFENGGTVFPFPRLLYEGIFQRKLDLSLRICLLTRLLIEKSFASPV